MPEIDGITKKITWHKEGQVMSDKGSGNDSKTEGGIASTAPCVQREAPGYKPHISDEVGMFNGKWIREMTKDELIDVIRYMASDRIMTQKRTEHERNFVLGL
jgi:hypothetical protein